MSIFSIRWEKGFNQSKQLIMSNFSTIPKGCNLYKINNTFVSLVYTFSMAGNIIAYTPIQGTDREKYLNHII